MSLIMGWLSIPEQVVGLGDQLKVEEGGRRIEAIIQVSQLWMWCLLFQGPAMRAPRDTTEGSGVGLGKEDGGMVPLGEKLTAFPHCWLSQCQGPLVSQPKKDPFLSLLFMKCPWCPWRVPDPMLELNQSPPPWRAQQMGVTPICTAAQGTHVPDMALPLELGS